ncbi:hypothetical protein FRC01_012106, partial [Tulasnella sp. 417]
MELVDDLVERVPRILEIYENAIQGPDPPGRLASIRLPLLIIVGTMAEPRTITIIDENLKLLQCNFDTMAWLVFAPFFNDRILYDQGETFHVATGGNILRSYADVSINPTTWMIDKAVSRFGVSRMVQQSTRLCKMTGPLEE